MLLIDVHPESIGRGIPLFIYSPLLAMPSDSFAVIVTTVADTIEGISSTNNSAIIFFIGMSIVEVREC